MVDDRDIDRFLVEYPPPIPRRGSRLGSRFGSRLGRISALVVVGLPGQAFADLRSKVRLTEIL
jgi:hypothetical protein